MEANKHMDVEYHVRINHHTTVFNNFQEAATKALTIGITHGDVDLDVIIWSEEGAKYYGGDDAVSRYREDPDASVFERFQISVNNAGRVP